VGEREGERGGGGREGERSLNLPVEYNAGSENFI
jgi:hypothetical protein